MGLRKIIFLLATALLLIFFGVWLLKYLTMGTITVKTDTPGSFVRVLKITDGGSQQVGGSTPINGSVNIRLRPGRYQVFVYIKSMSASKNLSLKSRQHITTSITPLKTVSSEPIYGNGVKGLAARGARIIFVRENDGRLAEIDPSGAVKIADNQHIFTSAKWCNVSFGVAQSQDKSLYAIKNSSVGQLTLPFDTGDGKDTKYAVSPDQTVYVSHGHDVYRGVNGENFTKIYSSGFGSLELSASNKLVAVFYTGNEGSEGTEGGTLSPQIVVMDPQGRVTATKKGVTITAASWSPDSSRLLARGLYSVLLFNPSLSQYSSLPSDGATSAFVWKDNNSFLYSINRQLWLYNTSDSNSSLLSTISGANLIDQAYLDENASAVYLSAPRSTRTGGSTNGNQLLKINLKGQSVPSYLAPLNVFLPENIGVCALNYVNFTTPIITVSYPESTTTPDFCVNAAKGELDYYGVKPDKFQYQASPGSL